eukprot:scaffold25505_cov71-Phaeocystis_antarctica.AAC.3
MPAPRRGWLPPFDDSRGRCRVAGLTSVRASVLFLEGTRDNPELSKGMPCNSAARTANAAAAPHSSTHAPTPASRGALHPVSCWHRLAHLTQSFLDTIHTDAAVYVFSALNEPTSLALLSAES